MGSRSGDYNFIHQYDHKSGSNQLDDENYGVQGNLDHSPCLVNHIIDVEVRRNLV